MAHLVLPSPVGHLTLFEEDGAIVAVEWGRAPGGRATPLLAEARDQLAAYFRGRLRRFDLPLGPHGTRFQRRAWKAMTAIPYGEVRSYVQLARRLRTAPRPVGGACRRNPIPIVIPCHRVVAANGLGGYSGGAGLHTKRLLLRLEGALA
jgi:methylated-DNA-[protein]-cysteine S-methyltransferase